MRAPRRPRLSWAPASARNQDGDALAPPPAPGDSPPHHEDAPGDWVWTRVTLSGGIVVERCGDCLVVLTRAPGEEGLRQLAQSLPPDPRALTVLVAGVTPQMLRTLVWSLEGAVNRPGGDRYDEVRLIEPSTALQQDAARDPVLSGLAAQLGAPVVVPSGTVLRVPGGTLFPVARGRGPGHAGGQAGGPAGSEAGTWHRYLPGGPGPESLGPWHFGAHWRADLARVPLDAEPGLRALPVPAGLALLPHELSVLPGAAADLLYSIPVDEAVPLIIVTGTPGGAVPVQRVAGFLGRLPDDLRGRVRLGPYGPGAGGAQVQHWAQAVADTLRAPVTSLTGTPLLIEDEIRVSVLREASPGAPGPVEVAWQPIATALTYRPRSDAEALPPVVAQWRPAVDDVAEISQRVYPLDDTWVVEVLACGLWLRRSDAADVPMIRHTPFDPVGGPVLVVGCPAENVPGEAWEHAGLLLERIAALSGVRALVRVLATSTTLMPSPVMKEIPDEAWAYAQVDAADDAAADDAGQDYAGQDYAGQDYAGQDYAGQDDAWQNPLWQNDIWQDTVEVADTADATDVREATVEPEVMPEETGLAGRIEPGRVPVAGEANEAALGRQQAAASWLDIVEQAAKDAQRARDAERAGDARSSRDVWARPTPADAEEAREDTVWETAIRAEAIRAEAARREAARLKAAQETGQFASSGVQTPEEETAGEETPGVQEPAARSPWADFSWARPEDLSPSVPAASPEPIDAADVFGEPNIPEIPAGPMVPTTSAGSTTSRPLTPGRRLNTGKAGMPQETFSLGEAPRATPPVRAPEPATPRPAPARGSGSPTGVPRSPAVTPPDAVTGGSRTPGTRRPDPVTGVPRSPGAPEPGTATGAPRSPETVQPDAATDVPHSSKGSDSGQVRSARPAPGRPGPDAVTGIPGSPGATRPDPVAAVPDSPVAGSGPATPDPVPARPVAGTDNRRFPRPEPAPAPEPAHAPEPAPTPEPAPAPHTGTEQKQRLFLMPEPGQSVLGDVQGSTQEQRAAFKSAAGTWYSSHLAVVNALLAKVPSLRSADPEAAKTDLLAVRAYLSAGASPLDRVAVNAALRGAGEQPALQHAACLVSGLRRLPRHLGMVRFAADVPEEAVEAYRPGARLSEPAIVEAVSSGRPLEGGVEFVIWSSTGRRVNDLADVLPSDEVLFLPGTSFVVLERRPGTPGTDGVTRILLRDAQDGARPGTDPQAAAAASAKRDDIAKDRLERALAQRLPAAPPSPQGERFRFPIGLRRM
ncbi:hypothetical protein KIH74_35255 [Kineosporia sp. J2-2]|uniref:NAD(+)--protein-arginine ADP-ribosyltransferase n=1 Tax=Kineosporia corallincola TaxID=2835133 RepID=A0ABS5TTX7_9ACTN|nr:hypothetical protein [Kineosporia corallincola]MBT0774255.1 hypothetical protein [Kineosporia corallincola]